MRRNALRRQKCLLVFRLQGAADKHRNNLQISQTATKMAQSGSRAKAPGISNGLAQVSYASGEDQGLKRFGREDLCQAASGASLW